MSRDRAALGAFLRDRRDRLSPAQAGLVPFPGPRRVPGLRREELAVLAGLSADYYSRLEQGRQANVSDQVLDALARALRLDAVEHAHLRDLAAPSAARRPVTVASQRPDPGLLRVMIAVEHLPALLLGRRGDVLASNVLVRTLLGVPLRDGSSFMRFLLRDPLARSRIINWADFASASVASLRRELGRHPDDGKLQDLVDELRREDRDFSRWWDDHGVRDYASVVKRIDHPDAGVLQFFIEAVAAPLDADQRLVIYTVEPQSRTAQLLPMLRPVGAAADASQPPA